MEFKIKEALLNNSEELFGIQVEEKLIQFQKTRKDVEGDLTLVIFPFVKVLKCSPIEAGEKIGAFVKENTSNIESYSVVGGFLNIVIDSSYWISALSEIDKNDRYGFGEPDSKSTIMVEYSSPNTNKPLHLGHLRNNFLGYSVAEILKANGHKVIKTQIINDRGIHICKSMLAWQKFSPLNEKGERETPGNTGIKGDKLVGKYYVVFDKHLMIEANAIIDQWNAEDFGYTDETVSAEFNRLDESKAGKEEKTIKGIDSKIKELAKNQTSILREAKEMLIRWEGRDPETYLLWTTMNSWVYTGFESTYKAMGVDFDKLYYESDTFLLGKDLVDEGLSKDVFYRKDDGSVWIDLSDEGLDEKLVLRSDGTAVYMTQDVGTAVDRFKDYSDLEGMIYTVGNEQDHHFKVLFLILKKLGYDWSENCSHLSYGMVELPKGQGRMKSREGTVVDADDLMESIVDSAREMTQERGHLDGMSEEDREALFELIGMGGLKYFLLKVDPKKRIVFDPTNPEAIELNGNTGPYIQYAHARIKSLLAKADGIGELKDVDLHPIEKEILKQLSGFPNTMNEAAKNHSPALIANYMYELVKLYNTFFQSIPVHIEEKQELKDMRLILSRNVAKVIGLGMTLLGVKVPERM
ncbi:MAG: arginine--tRNA ligase [Crocinitomicaceae bacterium]|nr:arginine--tRNA ligase [Crocinitomicaceae bacterium]